ncbi:MAG TPA: alpha/beta hydrolase [Ktedonobacterales bacterium]|nr:alpha/beta hydrolase [Ktedonobacterales bacterium]
MIGSILLPLAAAVALLTALLVGFSYVRARVLLTPRRTLPSLRPADLGLSVEDVRIPGPRGSLAAWYLPARNGCTLICCHGIHDNRGQWLDQVARLHGRSGYGAVLFDFSGHGESDGRLVTYGARETLDVAAVLAYLQERGDVDMTRIGILGYSLGAITAILAAADIPELECVVVESGFADVHRDLGVLFRRYLGLPSFPFANLIVFFAELMSGVRLAEIRPARVIGRISPRAVLIIADLKDELANEPYDGEHLYAAAGEPKQLWQVADAHHVRAFQLMPDEWIARVGGFLDEYLASLPATPLLATRSQTPPRPEC